MGSMVFWELILALILSLSNLAFAANPATIVYNIEENSRQGVLTGSIDTLSIARGNAEFHLGPGTLTMFDFGSGRIAAMTYFGKGRFRYTPPNEAERYQLKRFTDADTLDDSFNKVTFFFTVALDGLPDTAAFVRDIVHGEAWDQLRDAIGGEFDHTWVNIANEIIGDLLSAGPGTYFNAYFDLDGAGEMVFIEDPFFDDYYELINLTKYRGSSTYDIIGGYSSDDRLPSERGVAPVDITHYDIDTKIDGNGDMDISCWVHFVPIRPNRQSFQLYWNYKNKLVSALDSKGDSLFVVRKHKAASLFGAKKDEAILGFVFNSPLEAGREDSILITLKSNVLEDYYGQFFYIEDNVYWYPHNIERDVATFALSFDCPDFFGVVSCGDLVESKDEGGRSRSRWTVDDPVGYISFNIGKFESRNFELPNLPTIEVFKSKTFRHGEVATEMLDEEGMLSTSDMIGSVGADVSNSVAFYSSMFGPCPFDTIRVVESFSLYGGLGSPGLIHLNVGTFQSDEVGGYDEALRAHEASHLWWGFQIDIESYRDIWILEGLARCCGWWYYQTSAKDKKNVDFMLERSRQKILWGFGAESVGYKAGPVVMGLRLSSTKSDDYYNIVYEKGGYIFHMLRYLMHDFKTGSDDAFAAFLKDLAVKYKGKIITTEKLRALLENHVGGDMRWFFDQWVYGISIPKYTFSSNWEKTLDGKYEVTCHVKQEDVPENFRMVVPLTVLFDDDKYVHTRILVDKPEADIHLPLLPYKPKKIIFNTYDAVLCRVTYR